MSTLLLTFANSDTDKLKTLTDEYTGVINALQDRQKRGDFTVISRPLATREQILTDIQAWEQDIELFLFSGHADRDRLLFEDGTGSSDGIAALLGRCPNLKIVVLNGCSTLGQVKELSRNNIPIVVATSSPISDQKATQFSIALFTNLAIHKLSFSMAFDRAIDTARVYGLSHSEELSRGGIVSSQHAGSDKAVWGVYYHEKDEILFKTWRLPTKDLTPDEGLEKVNDKLRIALTKVAKRYSITPTPNAALERFPFVINEPIRCLIAVKAETQDAIQFYDTPSWERFQMLLYAYRSVINLTTFALLAEVWGRRLQIHPVTDLPDEYQEAIKTTLFTPNTTDTHLSNLALMQILIKVVMDSRTNLTTENLDGEPRAEKTSDFINELSTLSEDLNQVEIKKSIQDLESKITNQDELKPYFASASETLNLCLEAETSFALVLLAFGFWAKYSLTSIKNIELLKFKHLKDPSYLHQLVPLQIGYVISRRDDERHLINNALESTSIILHPHGEWQKGGLNLSPFIIDKNALLRVAKSEVYYLMSYSAAMNDLICYRKVSSYHEIWTVLAAKKSVSEKFSLDEDEDEDEEDMLADYHSLLKDQLSAFALSVLKLHLE